MEMNGGGTKLLFRDKRRALHLYDIATQTRSTLLSFSSYVQWVPNSDVVVAQGFFAGVDPTAELLRLLEVAQGRDEATARDNVARSQAIRRLRKEDPELLRRTPVPGLDGRDHWERWQRLLDRLEAEGVEREVWVCCRQEPLRWRAPLREDGKAAPVRVPLLPSLDAPSGASRTTLQTPRATAMDTLCAAQFSGSMRNSVDPAADRGRADHGRRTWIQR